MRILRNVILAIGLAAIATACGGKSKADDTMGNTGGGDTMGDTGGDTGGDMYGGDMYGGDMGDPCGGGGDGMDPCEGGE